MATRRVKVTIEFELRDPIEYLLFEHFHPHIHLNDLLVAASLCPVLRKRKETVVEMSLERIFLHVYANKEGTKVRCWHCHTAYQEELQKRGRDHR